MEKKPLPKNWCIASSHDLYLFSSKIQNINSKINLKIMKMKNFNKYLFSSQIEHNEMLEPE